MSDGFTTAIIGFLVVLTGVAAGVFVWVNRSQRATRHESSRVLPLFGTEHARALDDDPNDDLVLQSPPLREPLAAARPGAAGQEEELDDLDGDDVAAPDAAAIDALRRHAQEHGAGGPSRVPPVWRPAAAAMPHVAVNRALDRSPISRPFTPPHSPRVMSPPTAAPAAAPAASAPVASPVARPASRPVAPPPGSQAVSSEAIRFAIPTDGTLQFLPGRLEVVSGSERGREIRFVRQPGFEAPTVTFGRNEGQLYRHVQLVDPTVSRLHARMRLGDGGWYLTNLSTTNPVAHNARVMADEEEVPLADGDRVEMGEVVFRFRSR